MMPSTSMPETTLDDNDLGRQLGYGTGSRRHKLAARLLGRFREEVSTRFGYLPLLICCFITGLADGALYNEYGTFVSMQTGKQYLCLMSRVPFPASDTELRYIGNTIFLALGTSGQGKEALHDLIGPRLRGSAVISFSVQTILVAVAAITHQVGIIDGRYPSDTHLVVGLADLSMVALLSFQAAGQIVASRKVGIGEVPTLVITSLLCDFVIDGKLFAGFYANVKRNLRAMAFVLTLAGAIAGGCISKATGMVGPSLWLIVAIKAFVAMSWMLG
ncbi:uncharacterized protein PG998_010268 [Apiospora kogelbergensis]|uniref:uncharacterized protein n=1 Tax=Apiospora kogelbergensis TaxID=1337665 RepID=UPI003132085E